MAHAAFPSTLNAHGVAPLHRPVSRVPMRTTRPATVAALQRVLLLLVVVAAVGLASLTLVGFGMEASAQVDPPPQPLPGFGL
jgi:hypothetical protein